MEYKHFGVMLDCSRNAVMKVSEVKRFMDYLAKMGYNMLMLYAEDTYKIDEEPAFGYLRGGYSGAEIQEIDAYAKGKGIELIPCLQTLAHFDTLVSVPTYRSIVDVNNILLIDDEGTYALIEKIIKNAAENFTSRHINIGMDEAHMVGLGKYLDKHGYVNRFDLLNKHLARVVEIVKKYGFTPHMWSDMYFRLNNNGDYYGGVPVPKEIIDKVPEGVDLAYWDYHHHLFEEYDGMFRVHKDFNRDIWYAGAVWTWGGFAPFNDYTRRTMLHAMEAVQVNGIEHVIITMWGDNGKECSFFSGLAGLYTVRQYALGNYDEKRIADGFKQTFGFDFDDFMLLDKPNGVTKFIKTMRGQEQVAKTLLYTDPFMGQHDKQIEREEDFEYDKIAEKLFAAGKRAGELEYIFRFLGALCNALHYKGKLGVETRKAYRAGDKKALKALLKKYATAEKEVAKFHEAFKTLWFKENKPFGWEIQDARLGGVQQRLATCRKRLQSYIRGEVKKIEELEEEILDFYDRIDFLSYNRSISTNRV